MSVSQLSADEPAKEAVGRGYAAVAAGWRKWQPKFAVAGRAATAALVEAARVRPGLSVLDLAGGAGEPGLPLAEVVAPDGHVTITDLVPEMLIVAEERARARGMTNISFRQVDAEALPFADASFDRVTCRFALMHVPRAEQALREARRVLRPGGRAAFSVLGPPGLTPSFMTTIGVVMQYAQLPPPAPGFPSPYRFSQPGALADALRAAGFAEVEEACLVVPSPWPGPPVEVWESLPDHAPGFQELIDRLPPEQRTQVREEAIATISEYYDGRQVNFVQPMIVVTGVTYSLRASECAVGN